MYKIKKGLGFAIGAVVGAASVFSYQELDKKLQPTTFPILEREGYTLAYDTRGKIPFWTHEHLTKESLVKTAERSGMSFREDPDLYTRHRSSLSDYQKSGFDRGHIVPAGDERFSKVALAETFYLSNICPQHPQFNRGLWNQLENHLRSLVKTHGPLEVVSGPLFLSHEEEGKKFVTYQVIGENEVAVPTHFFKVILSKEEVWAYVIPNQPIKGSLEDYRFPIEKLEKISGICFGEHRQKTI
ncbi:MAG: DNA/RNA non-specific endonuclease [Chlamydiales bacterium]|nr:DNA/RNA non-specific endonuclease [Chlamydiales bacterium]